MVSHHVLTPESNGLIVKHLATVGSLNIGALLVYHTRVEGVLILIHTVLTSHLPVLEYVGLRSNVHRICLKLRSILIQIALGHWHHVGSHSCRESIELALKMFTLVR